MTMHGWDPRPSTKAVNSSSNSEADSGERWMSGIFGADVFVAAGHVLPDEQARVCRTNNTSGLAPL